MNAKPYLQQYKLITARIEVAERELADLKTRRTAIAVNLDGMPKGSRLSDRTARLAAEIADAEAEIVAFQVKATLIRRDIVRTLGKLDDPVYYQLLYDRYIQGYKWEAIAVDLHYSYQWVSSTLHDRALDALEKIIKT